MSRFRNAARSLASGYAALAVLALYNLASVPLAIHYLSYAEFGVWSVVTTITLNLALIDAGMSPAIGRILIDRKDHKEEGTYGSVIKTGFLVLLVQGAIIIVVGLVLSLFFPGLVDLPKEFVPIFRVLTAAQCAMLGLFFPVRMLTGLLQAHQRFDITNYAQILQTVAGFATQWITFHLGWGLYSLLAANAISSLVGAGLALLFSFKLKLFPPSGSWGRPSAKIFGEVFAFGRDIFLLSLGLTLLTNSQVFIITRTQGIVAAGIWSIATKTFTLAFQFVQKIFDFSGSALGEMIVRRERDTLRRRFRDILVLTAAVVVFVAASVAVCNGSFLQVWLKTFSHRGPEAKNINWPVAWPWRNDALMGLWLVLNCVSRCYIGLGGYAKQIRTMRWIYFLEGASFVVVASFVAPHFGVTGIIVVAIVANLAWSGAYGIRWGSHYLGVSVRDVIFKWLPPALRFFLILTPIAAVIWWTTFRLAAPFRLVLDSALMTIVGPILLWRVGLSAELRHELKGPLKGVLRRLQL